MLNIALVCKYVAHIGHWSSGLSKIKLHIIIHLDVWNTRDSLVILNVILNEHFRYDWYAQMNEVLERAINIQALILTTEINIGLVYIVNIGEHCAFAVTNHLTSDDNPLFVLCYGFWKKMSKLNPDLETFWHSGDVLCYFSILKI